MSADHSRATRSRDDSDPLLNENEQRKSSIENSPPPEYNDVRKDSFEIKKSPKKEIPSKSLCREILSFRQTYILILTPIILCPFLIVDVEEEMVSVCKCAWVLITMAVYWSTEVIPLPVTALIPVVIMPCLGLLTSGVVAQEYLKNTNMMFVGSLVLAVAIEHWDLHKRIGLRVLLLVGSETRWLMIGIMIPTWFLSMWISNTAATAMMIPIVQGMIEQIQLSKNKSTSEGQEMVNIRDQNMNENQDAEKVSIIDDEETALEEKAKKQEEAEQSKIEKALKLSICYSATVGGIATLTGSPPNLIMQNEVISQYSKWNVKSPLSFGTWMIFALPVSVLCLILSWLWLQFFFLGIRSCFRKPSRRKSPQSNTLEGLIRKEYEALGPVTFAEKVLIAAFILLALMWLTRDPGFAKGWDQVFPQKITKGKSKAYVSDATASIFVAILLFILPSRLPRFRGIGSRFEKPGCAPPLLTWQVVSTKLPWGVVILLGGGFALAKASKESGLSDWVGLQLVTVVEPLHPVLIVALLAAFVAAFTEITSNTATATLLMPILVRVSQQLGLNPLYLMFPAILACSFAFMLPVATPPNAVVFSYGGLKVSDMIKVGFGMNIICVFVVTLAVNTWGIPMFDMDTLPYTLAEGNFTVNATASNYTFLSNVETTTLL